VVDKYFAIKKDFSEATRIAYKETAEEFSNSLKHRFTLTDIKED